MAEEEFRQLQAEMERRAHPPSELADAIDKGREFTAALRVTMCGRAFTLKPQAGLVALFRFVSWMPAEGEPDEIRSQQYMGTMHQLLQDVLEDGQWHQFEEHAISSKAGRDDVERCIREVVEAYTARPYWPGLRLLASAANQASELDGWVLMGTGRGVASFTAREVCNLQLVRLLQGQQDEQAREVFLEDLYLDYSPEENALGMALKMIQAKRKAEQDGRDPADHRDPEVPDPAGGPAAGEGGPGLDQPGPG